MYQYMASYATETFEFLLFDGTTEPFTFKRGLGFNDPPTVRRSFRLPDPEDTLTTRPFIDALRPICEITFDLLLQELDEDDMDAFLSGLPGYIHSPRTDAKLVVEVSEKTGFRGVSEIASQYA